MLILITTIHYHYKLMLHAIYFTDPWDRGMGWTVNIHVSVRGTGGHSVECPTIPWDRGMGWTVGHMHL